MATKRAASKATVSNEVSDDTKVILTVLGLFFFYPIGLVFMFMWMKTWPRWVKILLSLPLILIGFIVLAGIAAGILIGSHSMKNKTHPPVQVSTPSATYE